MQAAKAARRRRVVRPELPREALEASGGATSARSQCSAGSSSTSTCSSATRRTCRKGLGIAGPGGGRRLEARSEHVLRHDRPRGRAVPADQGRRHDAARGALDQPAHVGRGGWIDGQTYVAPTCELDVHDRVGGGDGFAAGLFYGLLTRRIAGGGGQARLGPRRAGDRLPRRHDHGDARTGARLRPGRLGAHPAVAKQLTPDPPTVPRRTPQAGGRLQQPDQLRRWPP